MNILINNLLRQKILGETDAHLLDQLPPKLEAKVQSIVQHYLQRVDNTKVREANLSSIHRQLIEGTSIISVSKEANRIYSDKNLAAAILRVAQYHDMPADAPPETAIVLSGGGAKGSFQVGALAYMAHCWDALNVKIVIGTSVGAVNALPLSQSGRDGIHELLGIYFDLHDNDDMFIKSSGHLLADGTLMSSPLGTTLEGFLGLFGSSGNALESQVRRTLEARAKSLSNPWDGVSLWDGAALLEILFMPGKFELETRLAIMTAVEEIMADTSLYRLDPLRALIAANLDVAKVGTLPMRLAMVCLEDGHLYYMDEQARLLQDSPNPAKAERILELDGGIEQLFVNGILASAANPIIFPPVELRERGPLHQPYHYVDGGVRAVLPLQDIGDLDHIERVISVAADELDLDDMQWDGSPKILDVVFRAKDISGHETLANDINSLKEPLKTVSRMIYPSTSVHGFATIDPGLIRINIDYGYMVAYSHLLDVSGKKDQVNGWAFMLLKMCEVVITDLRFECWVLEHQALVPSYGGKWVFNTEVLAKIRSRKQQIFNWTILRFHAAGNDPESIPICLRATNGQSTTVHSWWETWEKHNTSVSNRLEMYDLWTKLPIAWNPDNTPMLEPLQPPTAPYTNAFGSC